MFHTQILKLELRFCAAMAVYIPAAISQAVADGKRKFVKIAVCGGKDNTETPCPPCGICRQVLREFCEDNFRVVMKNGNSLFSDTIGDLLPLCFQKSLLDL